LGSSSVVTLALGSRPRQGFVRGRAKRETQECGRVWEWTLTLPSELPCWELESRWTPEFSKSNYKGQNPSPWKIIYIIGKLLKRRCLKWARMTHLDIWNTIYSQKKGRKSNWQFDSRPRKVRNRPNSLACKWRATCCWFCFRPHPNWRSVEEVIVPQSRGNSNLGDFGIRTWESRDKKPFGWGRRGEVQSILYRGRWWLPSSSGCGESCESEIARGLS
jgi:hypothetical protein